MRNVRDVWKHLCNNLCFIHVAFSTQKALEFVVMHGHSCMSGPIIDRGMGGHEEEEEEQEYKGVGGCRL